ncbi:MAG: acyl carrier protein [Bacteroidia bacterium]|nr:acyl carrier protein [Bacteroidia bacterium]
MENLMENLEAKVARRVELENQIKDIILEVSDKSIRDYSENAQFKSDLGLDSLDMVELIMICEKDFYITLPDSEWEGLRTPSELIDLISSKV